MAQVLHKRGTRAQIDAAAAINGLAAGEPYLITDENRPALGVSTSSYVVPLLRQEFAPLTSGYSEGNNVVAAGGTAQTITLDGRVYYITLNSALCTFTFALPVGGVLAGNATILLKQDATGGRAVAWPGGLVQLGAQTLPTAANKHAAWVAWTPNGGTTYVLSPAGVEA